LTNELQAATAARSAQLSSVTWVVGADVKSGVARNEYRNTPAIWKLCAKIHKYSFAGMANMGSVTIISLL
jgi:hypothetical protein